MVDYSLPQLFKTLVDQGASDLHIAAGSPPRLRLNGQIVPLNLPPITEDESAELCFSVLTESQKKTLEQDRELDLSFNVRDLARFRGNIFYESSALAGAFRFIPIKIHSLQELGTPPSIERLCHLKRGLILITGPTGSGKSTTLAAMIDHINSNKFCRIVTIEDPIEFIHNHKNSMVNQREIGSDTNSFSKAMKSVLRQDPDVIMVGELRDLETISSALTMAETGHLVFATLHTNDAISSINRIIDAFPPHQQSQVRTQLAMTLECVVSQSLIQNTQGGRSLAMEVMAANQAIRSLVNEGKINQLYSSIQSGQSDSGMQTMNQALINLISSREITKEVALSSSSKPDELLEILVNRANSPRKPRR